jgi:hypothetical protein
MAGQVAYHLMEQAGMARAPWAVTTVVSCLPVLVLGMGSALAHMLRADAEAVDALDIRTGPLPVLRSLARSPEDQAGPGRRGPEAGRDRSVRQKNALTPRPQRGHGTTGTWPATRTATGGSGPSDCPEAGHSGEASITASATQRRSHGLQRDLERPGAYDQHRANRVCPHRLNYPSVRRVSEAVPPAHRLLRSTGVNLDADHVQPGADERWHVHVCVPQVPNSVRKVQRDCLLAEI